MRRIGRLSTALVAIILIAACAHPVRLSGLNDPDIARWSGRLALKVFGTPVQAFTADFELQGNAQEGTLLFTTPLGNTLARLRWSATDATLQTTGAPTHFDSLSALTQHTTGTDIPIASLFEWLRGRPIDTPGWEADLHEASAGRISARKLGPNAAADLKIILDH